MRPIACILLLSLCAAAQTAKPTTPGQTGQYSTDDVAAAPAKRDVYKEPRLEDIHVDVDNEGRFHTLAGGTEQLGTLKISDLPGSSDDPLSIEATFKCTTFEALVVENEKKAGALAKMVPADVLAAVLPAASWCLGRNLMSLRENMHAFVFADIGAMVDAQAELDQREYGRLVERYNALVEKHNALLAVARDFASQLLAAQAAAARQQQINNALAIYQLMPKYSPPQTINIQVTDCARLPALCGH